MSRASSPASARLNNRACAWANSLRFQEKCCLPCCLASNSTLLSKWIGRGGGIRTPTRGFGDRWSAVKPTPLCLSFLILLDFLVRLVLPAIRTEFLHLQPLRGGLLVLGARIVPVLAFSALKSDNLACHVRCPSLFDNVGDGSGAHRASAFADGEPQPLVPAQAPSDRRRPASGHRHRQYR